MTVLEGLRRFAIRCWETNDPPKLLVGRYTSGQVLVHIGDKLHNIAPLIAWKSVHLTKRIHRHKFGPTVKADAYIVGIPGADPASHDHKPMDKESTATMSDEEIREGDRLLILVTQKPVTYIVLGKL